jgi:hypothetical protein
MSEVGYALARVAAATAPTFPPPFTDLDGLKRYVMECGGVATVQMRYVRDAFSHGRLGVRVRQAISLRLIRAGIGHLPAQLPDDQDKFVRLYDKNSEAGQWIDKGLEPNPLEDEMIQDRFAGAEAAMIDRIRKIVCGEAA